MAQSDAGQSSDDESLKDIFDQAMKLYDSVESGNESTSSDSVQLTVKNAISKFEKATRLVSVSGIFSRNESIRELPTETLKYLLLPALLGTLSLKLCGQPRAQVIEVADVYFRDFLQRCKDYGVTDIEAPQPKESPTDENRPQSETDKIANMVVTREAKIKRYKEGKELKEKLSTLNKAMSSPNVDDEVKREYFTLLLQSYVNQALDEISSIDLERPMLEYMKHHHVGTEESKHKKKMPPPAPLKPVIITRDAVQKAIYGLGYPGVPTVTIEEFYDQRVREGLFPGSCTTIPNTTIQNTELDADEAEQIRKENLEETEDAEELARKRNMDEYKDDHRRGWGNRHNRS